MEFENHETQQRAAWSMYVELSKRIATVLMDEGTGILRDTLTSHYNNFKINHQILRETGPDITKN